MESQDAFDTALLGEVLEHFAHPETLLIQIHRLLQERWDVGCDGAVWVSSVL